MHTRRVFYTHIMKTGGTSLHRALTAHFGRDHTYPRDTTVATKTFSHLLLDMDPAEQAAYRYFCVHQPAWVAFEGVPDACKLLVVRDPVARTISHLRQLARSPHAADDIEEIYDDPTWRERLDNHQTQFLADTRERGVANPATDGEPDMHDPEVKRRFEEALVRFWGTAVKVPMAVGDEELTTALATLERYDIVGVTEELDLIRERISGVTGIELQPLGRQNTTDERLPVSESLRARIEADNEHDLALHTRARELAGA